MATNLLTRMPSNLSTVNTISTSIARLRVWGCMRDVVTIEGAIEHEVQVTPTVSRKQPPSVICPRFAQRRKRLIIY